MCTPAHPDFVAYPTYGRMKFAQAKVSVTLSIESSMSTNFRNKLEELTCKEFHRHVGKSPLCG